MSTQEIFESAGMSIEEVVSDLATMLSDRLKERDLTKLLAITFLDVDECAALLRVSKKSVQEWVSGNRIPYRKAGGRVIFLLSEILVWTLPADDRFEHCRLTTAAGSKLGASHLAEVRGRKN